MKHSFRAAPFGSTQERGLRFTQVLLVMALVALGASGRLFAQATKPVDKPADVARPAEQTYRLTYTVTESDGAKRVGVQHFSLTVNPGSYSSFKLGSKVPITTGSYSAGSAQVQTQNTYLDVGLNVKARLTEYANGQLLESQVEQSGVAEAPNGDTLKPVIRQVVLQDTALLTIGKPVVIGALDTPGSTRHLDIEVVMELVR
jgi:hypothetical protein